MQFSASQLQISNTENVFVVAQNFNVALLIFKNGGFVAPNFVYFGRKFGETTWSLICKFSIFTYVNLLLKMSKVRK